MSSMRWRRVCRVAAWKVREQAQTLEPIDEIVGEQEQVVVGFVRKEVARLNTAQGVVAFELLDDQLNGRRARCRRATRWGRTSRGARRVSGRGVLQ